jgi:hypothetical protein
MSPFLDPLKVLAENSLFLHAMHSDTFLIRQSLLVGIDFLRGTKIEAGHSTPDDLLVLTVATVVFDVRENFLAARKYFSIQR